MDPARFLVRRATVDDLSGLQELWTRAHLQVLDLERWLTDFQLVISPENDLVAAIGLRVAADQGWLYGEAFAQPGDEDGLRQLMWERVAAVVRNRGLVRLWTLELAPFWHQVAEFREAEPGELKKLPGAFGAPHQRWQTLVLRDEAQRALLLEQEFEMFQQHSRTNMNEVMSQAQMLRYVAYGVTGVFLAGLVGFAIYVVMRRIEAGNAGRPRRR